MKRIFPVVLVLVLVVSMIAACAPAPYGAVSPSTSSNITEGKIQPSKYLVDSSGNITHYVYFIQNKNQENCIIVAGDSSAPAIYCN